MTLGLWVALFVVESLFWVWVLFLGGAERLEGTWFTVFLVDWRALDWSAGGIKLVGGALWLVTIIVFVLGLFEPSARSLWLW